MSADKERARRESGGPMGGGDGNVLHFNRTTSSVPLSTLARGRLLTADDVASIMACSRSYAFRLLNSGALRVVRSGRLLRVWESDLLAYLAACETGGSA